MKYLKKFETHSQYETYINGSDVALPNVSLCVQQNEVHYNPIVIVQPLIATYNVTDASNPTLLFVGAESMGFSASTIYDKIEIDGVEIDMSDLVSIEDADMTLYGYQISSTGEHVIQYTLKDPTMIGAEIDEETSMLKIGATFMTCPITSFEIPNSVTTIGNNAFYDCSSLTNITIPSSVTTISERAFAGCSSLTSVVIPDNVTSIGNQAFLSCTSLTSVTIGNGVTTIGEAAFYSCSNLAEVTIPDSVTSIGNSVFNNCDGLTSATIEATTPPTIGSYVFASLRNYTIWVPAASVDTYKAASGWSIYASRIHEVGGTLF